MGAGEAGAAFDQQSPRRGLAHRAAEPQIVTRLGAVAPQPARTFLFRSDQRERRDRAAGVPREIAAGERQPVAAAGRR